MKTDTLENIGLRIVWLALSVATLLSTIAVADEVSTNAAIMVVQVRDLNIME